MALNKTQLSALNTSLEKEISKLLIHFNVNLNRVAGKYCGKCPIHNGDNSSAFNYSLNTHNNWNYCSWRCYTHNCHRIFADNTIGLVRGLLSNQNENWRAISDKTHSFPKTLQWIENFLGVKTNSIVVEEKSTVEFRVPDPTLVLTRGEIRDMMGRIPKYFMGRGFQSDLLNNFDVGAPIKPIPKYYFREFVPVYENNGENCIGAMARSVFNKCPKCAAHHDAKFACPKPEFAQYYSKWKAWEFNRGYSLYNLWNAKSSILKTNSVILVEGTGSVWRLKEAGIENVVASYGTNLSFGQKELLKSCGAEYLWLCFDNDKAGDTAFKTLGKELWPHFFLRKLNFPAEYSDIGEINNKDMLNDIILKQVKNFK